MCGQCGARGRDCASTGAGGRIQVIDASIFARDVEVARASALLLRGSEVRVPLAQQPAGVPHSGPEGISTQWFTEFARGESFDPEVSAIRPGFHAIVEA